MGKCGEVGRPQRCPPPEPEVNPRRSKVDQRTHMPRSPGIEEALAGRGATLVLPTSGRRSSASIGAPVLGLVPSEAMYFSMRLRSNTCPDVLETTGSLGTLPEMPQNILGLKRYRK